MRAARPPARGCTTSPGVCRSSRRPRQRQESAGRLQGANALGPGGDLRFRYRGNYLHFAENPVHQFRSGAAEPPGQAPRHPHRRLPGHRNRVRWQACPFLIVASRGADGQIDVSPKGDPAGFVSVLDEKTLAIPDPLGNNRLDKIRDHPSRITSPTD